MKFHFTTKFVLLLTTLGFFSFSALAAIGNECAYDSAKSTSALTAGVSGILAQAKLPFQLNMSSLRLSCRKLPSGHYVGSQWGNQWTTGPDFFIACTGTVSAQDGTAFIISGFGATSEDESYYQYYDNPNYFSSILAVLGFYSQQATDAEGNGVGPATCTTSLGLPGNLILTNKKSGAQIYEYYPPSTFGESGQDPQFSYPQ